MSFEYHWHWWARQPEILAADERRIQALEVEARQIQWQTEKLKRRIEREQEKGQFSLSRRECRALHLAGIGKRVLGTP